MGHTANEICLKVGMVIGPHEFDCHQDRQQAVVTIPPTRMVVTILDDGQIETELSAPGRRIGLRYFDDGPGVVPEIVAAVNEYAASPTTPEGS